MRELFFRGFHPCENGKEQVFVNGKWIKGFWRYGYYVKAELLNKSGFYEHFIIEEKASGSSYMVILETVGQFTGLIDKNGTKIFEGDILFAYKHGFTGVVEYNSVIASFMVKINDSTDNFYHYSHFNEDNPSRKTNLEYTEVIGNIFSNPELMEVK